MSQKRLADICANVETDDRWRPTGMVELLAIPEWLKTDRYVTGQLTPTAARLLAIDLLRAAERAASAPPVDSEDPK